MIEVSVSLFWKLLLGAVMLWPICYLLGRAVAAGWYQSKLDYQKRLLNGLEGGEDNGEQAEK